MASIFNLDEWFLELCQSGASATVNKFVDMVKQMPEDASKYLAETPQSFADGNIFTMIRTISINAIVPIAIIILTMVVCYDFISSFMNCSTRDMDIEVVGKLCFKLAIGIFLLNHVFDFTTGIFALGQTAVEKLVSTVNGNSPPDADTAAAIEEKIKELGIGECLITMLEAIFCMIIQLICSVFVQVICISRMLEIYIYCSISPIPFATLTNREWGSVGTNFIKNMFALAFQAFFMEICLVIFNSLVIGALTTGASIDGALVECMVVSVMLCFTMFKCGSIAKSIFNAI